MNDQSAVHNARALPDVETIRRNARKDIEDGAITSAYTADREQVIKLLNEALATEIICTLRYRHDYFMARGIKAKVVAAELLEHANQELEHADSIAERIVQLGGEPDFNPDTFKARAHAEYRPSTKVADMLRENLIAERIAIDSYREFIQYLGDKDSTTKRMLESILAVEEEHADDLADLLYAMPQEQIAIKRPTTVKAA
jgi:bacterioferritin